jgi:hypothetical protein
MCFQEIVRRELDKDAEDLASTSNNAIQSLKRQLGEQPEYRDVPSGSRLF